MHAEGCDTKGDAVMAVSLKGIGTSTLIRRTLSIVLALSLLVGVSSFYLILRHRALEAGSKEARLLLKAAVAVSAFTDEQVFSLTPKLPNDTFFKQVVPFYAANAVFQKMRTDYPLYTFRQPALNPTNPNDRPTPHEVELIGRFRDDPSLTSLDGVRKDEDRTLFYVAHPIRISDAQCLTCHSTPDKAPPAMVVAYGRSNGFGWHLNDTVGMVELSVPITEELRGTTELAATLAVGLFIVCVVIYLALTSTLGVTLVAPLRHLASAAEAASLAGNESVDLPQVGTSELRRLSRSISRLDTSLRKALRQISGAPTGRSAEAEADESVPR